MSSNYVNNVFRCFLLRLFAHQTRWNNDNIQFFVYITIIRQIKWFWRPSAFLCLHHRYSPIFVTVLSYVFCDFFYKSGLRSTIFSCPHYFCPLIIIIIHEVYSYFSLHVVFTFFLLSNCFPRWLGSIHSSWYISISNFIFPGNYQCCSPMPYFKSFDCPPNLLCVLSIFPWSAYKTLLY